MGSNSSTAHVTYAISPTAAATTTADPAATSVAETYLQKVADQFASAKASAAELQNGTAADPVAEFSKYSTAMKNAKACLNVANSEGADIAQLYEEMKDLNTDFLADGLSTEQAQEIAAGLGFEHAALENKGFLGPWLNPFVEPKQKDQFQDHAHGHYAKLLAGGTINGMTLADLHAKEGTPAPGTSSKPPLTTAADPAGGSEPAGFVAKHRGLVEALQHASATSADLPGRPDPADVASWTFGAGKSAAIGGMHTKSLHEAPDGSAWMFKPDNQAGGARAHAEAAASAVLHAAGVPSVPVYVKDIGGKTGSIQPLVKNAEHLPANPAKWSQPEVDAIVRYHVAAWAVGDHDGKSDNVLRTPSGGIVPIDQGQAFKFYGSDKLSTDYHPNASYGAEQPVFHQAYAAHQSKALAKDVKINPAAAHPVIKAFEAIPDKKWRAMLHDTAHEGAKSGKVAWAGEMRKRAAAKHGIPAAKVTPGQVADAFLDHACKRKNNLRSDFAGFFSGELGLSAGQALKHG